MPEALQPSVVSETSTLTKQFKVHVSKSLLNAAGWPSVPRPLGLIAEHIDSGRIRMHPEANVRLALDSKQAEIRESLELTAAFADRYRKAVLYASASGGDVHFTQIVASHLRLAMAGDREVYLEAYPAAIDIMSPDYRSKRLRDLKDETSI